MKYHNPLNILSGIVHCHVSVCGSHDNLMQQTGIDCLEEDPWDYQLSEGYGRRIVPFKGNIPF